MSNIKRIVEVVYAPASKLLFKKVMFFKSESELNDYRDAIVAKIEDNFPVVIGETVFSSNVIQDCVIRFKIEGNEDN